MGKKGKGKKGGGSEAGDQQAEGLQEQSQQLQQPPESTQALEPQAQISKKRPKWQPISEVAAVGQVQQSAQPPPQQPPILQPPQQQKKQKETTDIQQPPSQQPPPEQPPQQPLPQATQQPPQQQKKQKGKFNVQQPSQQQPPQMQPPQQPLQNPHKKKKQEKQPQSSQQQPQMSEERGRQQPQTAGRGQIPAGRGQPDRSRQSSMSSESSSVGRRQGRQSTPAPSDTSSVTSVQGNIGKPGWPFKEGIPPEQQQRGQRQQPAQPQQQRAPQQQPATKQQPATQQQQQRQRPASEQQQQRQQPAVQQQQQRQHSAPQQQQRQQPAQQQKPLASTELAMVPVRRKDPRKGGTLGRRIDIETNHIELKINPKLEIVKHYDVVIDPDKPKRLFRRIWDEYRNQHLRNYHVAFDDSKNAYSPNEIPEGSGEVQVVEDENSKPRTYKVTVKFAANVNMRTVHDYMASGNLREIPQDALQCIDIVLRNASSSRFVRVGRSYFSQPNRIYELGDGLQLWYGFFQSTVIAWKPLLNIDVAHKGFPMAQRVTEYMAAVTQSEKIEQISIQYRIEDEIRKFLKGLKVQYEIPGQVASRRTYRVNGLGPLPAAATFALDTGEQTTVAKYYANDKRYTIRYGNLPLIWVGPKDRKLYLPAELCTIVGGQVVNKKMNERQTAAMVRKAATNVDERKMKIKDNLRQANFNADPTVRAFGLNVGHDFERVKARILEPPRLQYKPQQLVTPSRGVWRANYFLQAEHISNWTIMNAARGVSDRDMDNFSNLLRQGGGKVGMQVEAPKLPYMLCSNLNYVDKNFQQLKDMRLVFVIVPDFGSDVYSKVKQSAELKFGCLTQCLKVKTLRRMNDATVGNILLKVNAKLNGRNHKIADISKPKCLMQPCMIMGADVTHPSPDQMDIPSVAAVCASYDATAFQYNFRWRLQPPRQEIIDDLDTIVRDQLMVFYQKTKCQPKHLIFFRDGVSEGQFAQVMNAEVMAIRKACNRLSESFKPAITFLVVQKRHHTRFFPMNPRDSEDRNGNVPAGTLVDTDITHPTDQEYYLVSHASIQGVARPTKYRVLYDDMNMNEDELQQLTYYLCHMFTRCTRSVSYPAPTYYAHLAAYRARVYLEGHKIDLGKLNREQASRVIQEKLSADKPMFYV